MRNSGPLKESSGLRRSESGQFVPQIRHLSSWNVVAAMQNAAVRAALLREPFCESRLPVFGRQKCSKHGSSSIRNGER